MSQIYTWDQEDKHHHLSIVYLKQSGFKFYLLVKNEIP